ncbi:hypothetical protein GGR56DRAFT_652780 [Xylariaceae sp. FL0804]|nr:hypothetical protein GGR56DRAFT_652780 [Xylariaceae sp. FL0804]
MGSFVFKWDHPASEVYVTGTFDGWKKTEKLEKVGEHFEKKVTLPDSSAKIFYKFVVDGNWVTDHTAPKEADESGNENNVLTPERIVSDPPATAVTMSSAAPESTTAALAADAPLKKDEDKSGLPGAFPETPALETELSVNPMPAAEGAVNPVTLAPGEKIPEHVTAESTSNHVKLDQESYENSDALPGGAAAFLSSAHPESTTAALAADAPIKTKVPEVVKESQEKANFDPEASAVPEEVKDKAAVEEELLDKVKKAPTTAEGTAGQGTDKTEGTVDASEAAASVAAAATAVGGAAVTGAVMAKDVAYEKAAGAATTAQTTATETAAANLPDSVKERLPESIQAAIASTAKEETREEVSPEVPTEVKQSITDAQKDPEAAANTEAVQEKKAVEAELLKEVKPVKADGEASKIETPAAVEKAPEETKPTEATPAGTVPLTDVPVITKAEETKPAVTTGPETAPVEAETKPAETTVPEVTTETEPAVTTGPETTPAETKTNGAQAATGSSSDAKPAESLAATDKDKKKKNRLSSMFGKVKTKLSGK